MSHNDNCENNALGDGGFGESAFGGATPEVLGGPLPSSDPFDIYCVEACGPVLGLVSHPEVTYDGDPTQLVQDPFTTNLILGSGGSYLTTNASLTIDVPIPQAFTWDLEVIFQNLPPSFSDLTNRHCFLGAFDAQGNVVGVFVSKIGLLYTGFAFLSGGNLQTANAVQALPNSDLLVEEGVYYTIRLVTSFDTGTTYVYWTKSDDVDAIGHQLRFVLPSIAAASASTVPADSTFISVRGSASDPTVIGLSSMCLGSGLIIPNIPPRADAGLDQAVRSCSIVRLDGSRSFDPEGSLLVYRWRLIDAPETSSFAFDSVDAITYPELTPTGFTNRIYSVDLSDAFAEDAFDVGDVVVLRSAVYTITAFGTDGNGFYAEIGESVVPDDVNLESFKILRQRGVADAATKNPTFLPDKPGLYKFDLIVFDGGLYSEPAVMVVNVTESPIPRGLIPDMRFIWDYLGDFWKLVEDRERIEVFWSALAQAASAELLSLWQTDYAKSLRDVQRTFQRRWLHYDLTLKAPSALIEFTSVTAVYGGIESSSMPAAGSPSVAGNHLDLFLPSDPLPVVINFSGAGTLTPQEIVDRMNAYLHAIDTRIVARTLFSRDGTTAKIRIDAPFAVAVSGTSTVTLFGTSSNTIPKGTAGVVIGPRSYRTERSLAGLAIREGDYLTVGAGTYRISRVVDDASDGEFFQRVTLLDDIDPAAGSSWLISGKADAYALDLFDALVTAGDVVTLEIVEQETGALSYAQLPATGVPAASPRVVGVDTTAIGHYLTDAFKVHFYSVTRRHYTPVDALVVDVPYLQEKIKNDDDTRVLRRNIDFFVDEFRGQSCLRFSVNNDVTLDVWEGLVPPDRMWAETTYLDNRPTIEGNFGIPAEFTLDDLSQLPNNIDYLSAVRGLWYAYFSGPTLFNVRAGVQILLGLPFAEVTSTIEEIRDDFSSSQGRMLLRDVADTELVRSYTYPHGLDPEVNPATGAPYQVGDTVAQFAPLVKGASVLDWVKDPTWFSGFLGQNRFAEIEKFNKFLVRVDSQAFSLSALLFVKAFVLRIKPNYTFPLFVVLEDVGEAEVSVSDSLTTRGRLTMFAGPMFGNDGQAQMFDQPRPGGGGFWNQVDTSDPNAPPVTAPPTTPVEWGMDEYLLAPRDTKAVRLTTTHPGGIPSADSLFYADMPVFTALGAHFIEAPFRHIPTSPGKQIGLSVVSTLTDTLNKLEVLFRGVGDGALLTCIFKKNGVTAETKTFTIPYVDGSPDAGEWRFVFGISVSVVPGDVLTAFVHHPSGLNTFVDSLSVIAGVGTDWASDTALAAGTYSMYLQM